MHRTKGHFPDEILHRSLAGRPAVGGCARAPAARSASGTGRCTPEMPDARPNDNQNPITLARALSTALGMSDGSGESPRTGECLPTFLTFYSPFTRELNKNMSFLFYRGKHR